jgi:hypothetical protein
MRESALLEDKNQQALEGKWIQLRVDFSCYLDNSLDCYFRFLETTMAEASDPQLEAAVKATMATMGKLIKKPPMSDKLLRKPPFRFLHDILTEVCS